MNKLFLISIFSILFTGCSEFKVGFEALKFRQIDNPDNYMEEVVEEVIEEFTDKKIDLTPFTGKEQQNFDRFKFTFYNQLPNG